MGTEVSTVCVASVEVIRGGAPASTAIKPTGRFVVEHYRNGVKMAEYDFPNAATAEGRNAMLDTFFSAMTQVPAAGWWLGLVSGTSYTALASTDTYVGINQAANGWDEFTAYTDGNNSDVSTTRPAWGPGAASAQATTNAVAAVFNITGAGTVEGLFLCAGIVAARTKNDHASGGVVWATGLFSSGVVTVANGDQLKVTYTVSVAG